MGLRFGLSLIGWRRFMFLTLDGAVGGTVVVMIDDMDELKALIIAKLDVIDLLDLLGMGIEDLVDLLEDELEENSVKLHKACR
jgi:hypothetical protein